MPREREYPAQKRYLGRRARDYEKVRTRKTRWHGEQEVVRKFVADIPEGAPILDVPFGTGRFVPFYLERKLQVHGADISEDMLRQAKQCLGEDFERCQVRRANAEDLPYPDDAFDYAISNRFIKWLPSLSLVEQVMTELARVTRHRILLQARVADVGSRESLSKRVRRWLRKRLSIGSYTTLYRDAELRAVFAHCGLLVVEAFDDESAGSNVRYYVLEKCPG